jgi:uncharacterized protein YgbK (DUF1537 family)
MDRHLPPIYDALRRLGAPILHYKVCSTLDSAPHIGSIGRAADLGLTGGGWAPLIIAAPEIGRWQAFGTLFARAGDGIHRLDRHPTMRVHPVTPMDEADLGRHLARQTDKRIGIVDLVALKEGRGAQRLRSELAAGAEIVALDVVDAQTLALAGRLVWEAAAASPLFALGSQGLEYALVAAWADAGLAPSPPADKGVAAERRIAVASGSCSPVTAEQLDTAEAAGFAVLAVDATRAADPAAWEQETARAAEAGLAALAEGRSPILATARGPQDPAVAAGEAARSAAGLAAEDFNARIGSGLGAALATLARKGGLTRVAIAGGDTSSYAARAFGFFAFSAEAALAPGAPLLHGHAEAAGADGLQIALKGGQMGPPDFFVRMRDGSRPAAQVEGRS